MIREPNRDDNGVVTITMLNKLKYMLQEGYLTEDEYNLKRMKLVDSFVLCRDSEMTEDSLLAPNEQTGTIDVNERINRAELSINVSEETDNEHKATTGEVFISDISYNTPSPIRKRSSYSDWSDNTSKNLDSSPVLRGMFLKNMNNEESELVSSPIAGCVSPSRLTPEQMMKYPERNRFRLYMEHVRAFTNCKNLSQHYESSKTKCKIAVNATTGSMNCIEKLYNLHSKSQAMGFPNEYITLSIIQIYYLQNQYWKVIRKASDFIDSLEEGFDNLKAVCLFMRGYCYQKIRNTRASFKDYHSVIDIDPHFYMALGNIATIYASMGKMNRAVEFWSRALDNDLPDEERKQYLTSRAKALLHLNKFDEALNDCQEALIIQPNDENIAKLRESIMNKQYMTPSPCHTSQELDNIDDEGSQDSSFNTSDDHNEYCSSENPNQSLDSSESVVKINR